MLKLIHSQHGRKGVLRRYQHTKLGVIEIVTMYGKDGSCDVIHIQDVSAKVRRLCCNGSERRRAQA
jgi:hypothetical protein